LKKPAGRHEVAITLLECGMLRLRVEDEHNVALVDSCW
jgi:hypothetical protein